MLIDGNSLVHRAFHAVPPLMTKSGLAVGAVYGFLSVFFKAVDQIKPDYVICAFDRPEPTFRHKEYKEYKAKRVKAPQELYDQIPLTQKVLSALGVQFLEKSGFEADDIIATLDHEAGKEKIDTLILTGDADTLQLVDDDTRVYGFRRGFSDVVVYDEGQVKEKYGLTPDQLLDYKALRGDPSDNIPGVPGIGEKTATELLKKYKTLDGVYGHLDEIKPEGVKNKLKEGKSSAYLSKKLGTLVMNVPVKVDFEKAKVFYYDPQKAFKLFSELEFKSLLSRLPKSGQERSKTADKKEKVAYETIASEKDLNRLVAKIKKAKEFVFDTETTGLNPISDKLVGISFATTPREAYYLPIAHTVGPNLDLGLVRKKLGPIFRDPKIKKIGHHIKFDVMFLKSHGFETRGIYFDTMIAAWLLESRRSPKLDNLAFSELGYEMMPITRLIGEGRKQTTFDKVSVKDATFYSAEDSDMTKRLEKIFKKRLAVLPKLDAVLHKIEMPLVPVLVEMETNGVLLDTKLLSGLGKKLKDNIRELEKKIYKATGLEFNIASPQQLQEVLFHKLKIDQAGVKKIKTGKSTAADELEKLRGTHPVIDMIIEFRELSKLLNTYVDALPELINKKTGRVHTSFNQTLTTTGRLSSSNPNLQNIPIKTDLGKKIRKAFIAQPGYEILSADYSQIELRVAAIISEDKEMKQAFIDGHDIHTETAAAIFNVPENKVTPTMRRQAKVVNFGILYGMSPYGLSQAAKITVGEAKKYIDEYFDFYKKIREYIDNTLAFVHKNSYVETYFGRRRILAEIGSGVPAIRNAAERMAINAPIQGTAADLMKMAMIKVFQEIEGEEDIKILLQVHDELVFEVRQEKIKKYAKKIKEIMENVHRFSVPIKVDVSAGKNWGELEELGGGL